MPLALLMLLAALPVHAEKVPGLYAAEVPVAGQGAEARSAAIREAFAEVLVKVTGDRALPGKAVVAKEVSNANAYVQQYRYRSLDNPPSQPNEEQAQPLPDRLLWVQFDEGAVNRLLREREVPVWGSARPAVLVWLGLENGGQRSIYQSESDPGLERGMTSVARARGLPVLFPLMDLEDRGSLQASDVWGGFEGAVRRASERYQPDVILLGRLYQRRGEDWVADWTLYQADTVKNWQGRGKTRLQLAQDGLQQTADLLAERFAPHAVMQGGTTVRIRVTGLEHLADYLLVKDYLSAMSTIEQLDLLAASPSEVSFLARLQGGRDSLEKGIMLGRVLEPVSPPAGEISSNVSPQEFEAQSLDFRLRQ